MSNLNPEQYDTEGLEVLSNPNRAIPGQSLTNDPDNKYPWEQAPEYTTVKDALDDLVIEMLEEDVYVELVSSVGQGVPVSDVVMQLLYTGFTEGKWNPDLFMLLIEPLMYVIMALCEKADVEYIIYRGEEEDEEEIDAEATSRFKTLKDVTKDKVEEKISSQAVPGSVLEKIKSFEVPESLLSRPEQSEQNDSLLAPRE
tara:strand:+ start:1874 stop:2470 length:597 start_codon:yes stop_codon:yes gene_type:complete